MSIKTKVNNTWCPGCGNFGILDSFDSTISNMIKNKELEKEDLVVISGIGCHGKIMDYVNLNSFGALHGRPIPPATGIKLANPKLKVVVFEGDGDAYDEGISHIIHAAKRNSDITVLIHDNSVFALTTGQATATSKIGYKGKSTPRGSLERPINPLRLLLESGATFVARSYAGNQNHLNNMIEEAIKHKGFSVVNILQPCVAFNNTWAYYSEKVYEMKDHDKNNKEKAFQRLNENDNKIPLGIFYQNKNELSFEDEIRKQN